MKTNRILAAVMIFLLLGIYACKSVETRSAMLRNQEKNYDKAIVLGKTAVENNPYDAQAYYELGYAYSLKEDPDMEKAYEYFRKSAQYDPEKETLCEESIGSNWATHFNLGILEYQSDNLVGASKEFEQATLADPRKVKGWLNLAMAFNAIVKEDSTYQEALYSATEKVMSLVETGDPNYGKVLALSGRVMIMKGDEDKAAEIFERLLIDDPTHAEEIERAGNDYLRQENYAGAIRMFEMAEKGYLETETENPDLYYNVGVCYLRLKMYLEAAEAYQQVIMYQPDNLRAFYSRLLAYYQGEFWDESIMYGQEYTETVAPEDPRGWQILGLTYSKKNMKELAEQAIKKFQDLSGH
ncbi:MAG: tetratricopeptide repeat protein [Bacteroidales bacterium]|nr:tetratricopeptide repeat protein [Candidatus Latescibacterota bacterium]